MRIAVTLVIEMTDEQVKNYAGEYGLTVDGSRIRVKDVANDVRSLVLTGVQGLFDGIASGATVTIKR